MYEHVNIFHYKNNQKQTKHNKNYLKITILY